MSQIPTIRKTTKSLIIQELPNRRTVIKDIPSQTDGRLSQFAKSKLDFYYSPLCTVDPGEAPRDGIGASSSAVHHYEMGRPASGHDGRGIYGNMSHR